MEQKESNQSAAKCPKCGAEIHDLRCRRCKFALKEEGIVCLGGRKPRELIALEKYLALKTHEKASEPHLATPRPADVDKTTPAAAEKTEYPIYQARLSTPDAAKASDIPKKRDEASVQSPAPAGNRRMEPEPTSPTKTGQTGKRIFQVISFDLLKCRFFVRRRTDTENDHLFVLKLTDIFSEKR